MLQNLLFQPLREKEDSFIHILKSIANMMKLQDHSLLESPKEYNQNQIPLINQSQLWPPEPTWKLQECRLVWERKAGK